VVHTDEAIWNSKRFVVDYESYDIDITFGQDENLLLHAAQCALRSTALHMHLE